MLTRGMRSWLVALSLAIIVGASGVGLWVTWDATQTSSADPVADTDPLITTTSREPPSTTTTLPPPPPCTVGSDPVAGDPATDWATVVIDRSHQVPPTFVPPDLVEVTQAGFDARDRVRAIVIDDLAALRTAAEANGTPIVVISGYRSFSYQQELFDDHAAEVGEEQAELETARPGHSEHQLGTAIDVLDPGVGELTTAFAGTPAGQWVAAHAHEFGFVVSYPEGAHDRSCYEFEPWHLRYVGRENAAAIHEAGVTPREWMLARAAADG
jgi:zinc D-Ala-D-Ala carboxypeptidase